MQIAINIPKEMWEWLHIGFLDEDDGKHAINAILKGTPLPKGHGRLKDVDRLESHDEYDGQGFVKSVYKDDIDDLITIIEADKTERDSEEKPSPWWKCERCGKLIPYMADFCHECADELLGEPPKPFEPKK